ncbi:MAG: VirD4-like conjugal transfer protein, CD1115 family [Oscillospiraceae bacterium]
MKNNVNIRTEVLNEPRYGERSFAKGVALSEDTRKTGLNNNVLVIGNSGCGKTGSYICSVLKNIQSSVILQDVKGLLYDMFADDLRSRGFNVINLDFTEPENSRGYDPLAAVRRHQDGSIYEQDIKAIADAISPPTSQADEPIWDLCSAMLIQFILAYTLEALPEEHHTMLVVSELFHTYIMDHGEIHFLKWIKEHPDSVSAKLYAEIQSNRTADRMFASYVGVASAHLQGFTIKEAKIIFSDEDPIDLADIGRRKTAVFIKSSDTDHNFDNIVSLFYTQTLQVLCREADSNPDGKLRVPVHMILDDFGATSAFINDFDRNISTIRSRDIYASMIIQSLSQLETMYKAAAAKTIINNCDTILFMGCNDPETARMIADRALRTADSILCMPRDKVYVIMSGRQAMLADKIAPYSMLSKNNEYSM